MGSEVKWVDVVEGIWRNSYCLQLFSEVGRKSIERADRKKLEVYIGEFV